MKATEMLSQVKELLGVQEEIALAQAALENGTIIEAESFEAGKEVFIITDDEKIALPIGDYMLEDGQMLKVEEEGIIASIGAAEKPAEEPAEEVEASEEVEAAEEEMGYATKQELAEVKEMIEEIKAMLEPKEEMSEELPEEKVEEVKEELSAVEEEPAKVKHNPEGEANKGLNLYAQKRAATTLDRVLSKMNQFKN